MAWKWAPEYQNELLSLKMARKWAPEPQNELMRLKMAWKWAPEAQNGLKMSPWASKWAPELQNGLKMSSGGSKWLENQLRSVQIAWIYALQPGSSQQGLWSSGYDNGYADLHCRRSRVRIPAGPSCDSSASSLCSLASSPLGCRRQEGVAPWIYYIVYTTQV